MDFKEELVVVLNRHSAENSSDTPDFVLAEYMLLCLEAFDKAVRRREAWYGREVGDWMKEKVEEKKSEGLEEVGRSSGSLRGSSPSASNGDEE